MNEPVTAGDDRTVPRTLFDMRPYFVSIPRRYCPIYIPRYTPRSGIYLSIVRLETFSNQFVFLNSFHILELSLKTLCSGLSLHNAENISCMKECVKRPMFKNMYKLSSMMEPVQCGALLRFHIIVFH